MSVREDLKEMARGFRWGRRPMVPRSAEPFTEEHEDDGFPTDWARTKAGVAARQVILQGFMHPLVKNELSLRVYGTEKLEWSFISGQFSAHPKAVTPRQRNPIHLPRRAASIPAA